MGTSKKKTIKGGERLPAPDETKSNVFYEQGMSYEADGKLDLAEECYRQAIDTHPQNAEAFARLGSVALKQHQLAQAVIMCQKAIQLRPESAVAHHLLGQALYQTGELSMALRSWKRALELDDTLIEAHYFYGMATYAQGR